MAIREDIIKFIQSGETSGQQLGLEIEHFVVNEKGLMMGFDEITGLISKVAEDLQAKKIFMDGYTVGYVVPGYSVTLEPACQFEVSIDPRSDIGEIGSIYREFINLWAPIFAERGYSIINKGNLPLVESGEIDPGDIPLSPKKRYKYMDAYFRESGKYGKYMMRASSSVQVSVDYRSEEDLIRKLRILEKISPILMIAMESKSDADSVLEKESDKKHLFRIQEWEDLDPDRTGFYPGSFDPNFGYGKIADVILHTPLILLTDEGETTDVGHSSAADLLKQGIVKEEDLEKTREERLIEHFISMGFFHFRVKKYIEIRVADSVPIEKALGYVALIKGLVYSDINLALLEEKLSHITSSEMIQNAVEEIKIHGFDAVIYGDRTAKEWYKYISELASAELPEKEQEYLLQV